MALASRGGSGLNPNAPVFIPAAYQQVEDFSTEWWNLVQSSTWFRDYWLRERHEEENNNNVTNNNLPGINNNNEQFQDFPEDIDGFTELELQLEEAVLLGIDVTQLEEDQALEWQQQQQLQYPKDFAQPGGTPVALVEQEASNLKSCAEAARSPPPLFEETKLRSD